jgi:hypothetical protein
VEKLFPVSSGFMLSTASSLTPISREPMRWSKNGFPLEHLEQKKKSPPSRSKSSIRRLPKEPAADDQVEDLASKANVKRQDLTQILW